jgi:hypothetical protein
MRELQLHTRAAQRSRSLEEIHMSETTKAAAWAVFQHHGGGGSAAGAATSSSYSRGGGGSGTAAVGRATRFKVVLETTSSSSSYFHLPISQPGLLLLHASVVITSCSNLEERCRRQVCVTALAAGSKWYLMICECVVVAGCMYFASADRSADEKWRSSFRK